jgi:hypothetical protein
MKRWSDIIKWEVVGRLGDPRQQWPWEPLGFFGRSRRRNRR